MPSYAPSAFSYPVYAVVLVVTDWLADSGAGEVVTDRARGGDLVAAGPGVRASATSRTVLFLPRGPLPSLTDWFGNRFGTDRGCPVEHQFQHHSRHSP